MPWVQALSLTQWISSWKDLFHPWVPSVPLFWLVPITILHVPSPEKPLEPFSTCCPLFLARWSGNCLRADLHAKFLVYLIPHLRLTQLNTHAFLSPCSMSCPRSGWLYLTPSRTHQHMLPLCTCSRPPRLCMARPLPFLWSLIFNLPAPAKGLPCTFFKWVLITHPQRLPSADSFFFHHLENCIFTWFFIHVFLRWLVQ